MSSRSAETGASRLAAVTGVLVFGALVASAAAGVRLVTGPAPEPLTASLIAGEVEQPDAKVLRVCADPNNLPFSNERREGFENRIAELVAREMGARLEYTWWAQRRGYVRQTLGAGTCDVLVGVPAGFERALTTKPYYRSTYAFVYRQDRALAIRSLDDSVLRRVRVGVQVIGDDYTNTPPAHALARRGIVDNIRGYAVQGDYAKPNPPARVIDAVVAGEVDVAIAWGPLAGYFARRAPVPLRVVPVSPSVDEGGLPMTFAIAMGVRRGERALRDTLDAILVRRQAEIDRILEDYGVPRAPSS